MRKIEGNVLLRLRDRDYLTSKRMSNSRFIEHIRVTARQVADHDLRSRDERNDIIDDNTIFPYIVGSLTCPSALIGSGFQCIPHRVEGGAERHHYGDAAWIWSAESEVEHCWRWNAKKVFGK
jgi:hypothetical protein